MRRLITFPCAGETLAGSLDEGSGSTGILMVTGGSQTRIGSHRMYERLAKALVERGFSCLRFDRRGVGDSGGEDPGYRDSAPDLAAAAATFMAERPTLRRLYGFGLCDGATALALFGAASGVNGLILANPWLVENGEEVPPPAAIKRHYRDRLLSLEGWKRLLTGGVSYRKLLTGLTRIAERQTPATLAGDVAEALRGSGIPTMLLLAQADNTAVAAEAEARTFGDVFLGTERIATDSHTFARPGDEAALLDAVLRAIEQLDSASAR